MSWSVVYENARFVVTLKNTCCIFIARQCTHSPIVCWLLTHIRMSTSLDPNGTSNYSASHLDSSCMLMKWYDDVQERNKKINHYLAFKKQIFREGALNFIESNI